MMELDLLLVPLQMVDLGGELTLPKFFVFKRFIHQYFNTLICTTTCLLLLLHFGNHEHLGYLVLQAKIPQTLKTLSPTESSHFSVSVLLWQKQKITYPECLCKCFFFIPLHVLVLLIYKKTHQWTKKLPPTNRSRK